MKNMLNNFKIEFKELFFSYFYTEISNSFFSRIFIKVYIVMARLKGHKKTSLVILFSFTVHKDTLESNQ